MKQRTFYADLGGRGGTADVIALSGFNVRSIVAACRKTDAGTAGQLLAGNYLLKPFTYGADLLHDDVPSALWLFRAADIANGTVCHEERSGTAGAVTNNGIIAPNIGPTRYVGQYGVLNTNAIATFAGFSCYLEASENLGQNWSFEAWVHRLASSAGASIYVETNAAVTNYLQILVTAAGTIQISHSGTVVWTGTAGAVPAGTLTHIGLSYVAATGTLFSYINGVSSFNGAYARTTYPGGQVQVGNGAANQFYVFGAAVYQNVNLVADDYLRHYEDLTQDYIGGVQLAGSATLARGFSGTVIFSNEVTPGFDAASYTVRMPLYPVNVLFNAGGIFRCIIDITEYEAVQ